MERQQDRIKALENILYSNKIASINDIKKAVGSNSRMTVYRLLCQLDYLTSYSHRGCFYTLPQIAVFDDYGLWSYRSVRFSQFGDLLDTAASLVQRSKDGFSASELELLLQVETQPVLLKLWRRKRISRFKLGGHFVYMSAEPGERRRQKLMRNEREVHRELGLGLKTELLADELRAGIILFFSLLDEKQRRLYAGLEAAKLGHGGDKKIAELLGLDPHTVSNGRQELFCSGVDRSGVRNRGGGRKRVEKKHLK
jgi:hypothetical protein